MAEVLTGVNGNILKWAREFYNMSLEEAANAIGVNYEKYCNWENGSDFPTFGRIMAVVVAVIVLLTSVLSGLGLYLSRATNTSFD